MWGCLVGLWLWMWMWPQATMRYGLGWASISLGESHLLLRIVSEDIFWSYWVVCLNIYFHYQDPDRLFKASIVPKYPQLTLYRFAAVNPSLEDGDDQAADSVVADPWCVGDREKGWDLW